MYLLFTCGERFTYTAGDALIKENANHSTNFTIKKKIIN